MAPQEPRVDLPAPPSRGTYLVLVEPEVVKIGAGGSLRSRLHTLRMGTYRRIALLAWTSVPEKTVHEHFQGDRLTRSRDFFRLSSEIFAFVNQCRAKLGFETLEAASLWDYGAAIEDPLDQVPWDPSWIRRLSSLSETHQSAIRRLLATMNFRSEERRVQRDRVLEWLEGPVEEPPSLELFGLKGAPENRPSAEEQSRLGRYHTHRRWHKEPNPTCEFCTSSKA